MISFTVILRTATIAFYLSRLPQRRQHFWCSGGFSQTESRYNCNLANLLSCGDADTILIDLLIRDMVVECCCRRFGCETIHPTQKFTSMNLLQMTFVITWAWSFLTSQVVEAVWGQKHHISAHTLALWHSMFGLSQSASSAYQRFIKKWDQIWLSASIQPQNLEF
jgi:hypothetical protein